MAGRGRRLGFGGRAAAGAAVHGLAGRRIFRWVGAGWPVTIGGWETNCRWAGRLNPSRLGSGPPSGAAGSRGPAESPGPPGGSATSPRTAARPIGPVPVARPSVRRLEPFHHGKVMGWARAADWFRGQGRRRRWDEPTRPTACRTVEPEAAGLRPAVSGGGVARPGRGSSRWPTAQPSTRRLDPVGEGGTSRPHQPSGTRCPSTSPTQPDRTESPRAWPSSGCSRTHCP